MSKKTKPSALPVGSPPSDTITESPPHIDANSVDSLLVKRLVRKLDFTLVPFLAVMYLFSSLDRSNIGNARLGSLEHDLHLEGNDFYNALMVFFIGYVVCLIPSTLLLKLLTPSLWIGTTVIIWGVSSTCIAATYNLTGLVIARLILGCAEAGLGSSMTLLLSFWYQRNELASRLSAFSMASILAGSFGGILAYVIMNNMDQVSGLSWWRWMFIIEGTPPILLGFICVLFFPNYPETASKYWLTSEEKTLAIQRGVSEGRSKSDDTVNTKEITAALLDYKTWMMAVIHAGVVICHVSFAIFLPTIVKAMGFQPLQAQLLSVPPYAIGCITLLVVCRYSDRAKQRGIPIIVCCIITVVGYTFLLVGGMIPIQYTGVVLISCGIHPNLPLAVSWTANNQFGHTRRGISISTANVFAQAFGLIGTQIYRESDSPNYRIGHTICLLFTFVTILVTCWLRYLLVRENKRRDSLYGPLKRLECTVSGDMEDENRMDQSHFRYII